MTEKDANTKSTKNLLEVDENTQEFEPKRMVRVFFLTFGCVLILAAIAGGLWYLLSGAADGFTEYMTKADQYYEQDDYVRAQTYYLKALSEDSTSIEARLRLGETYEKLGKYEENLPLMTDGITISPATYEFYEMMIRSLVKLNRINDARDFIAGVDNSYVLLKIQRNQPQETNLSVKPGTFGEPLSLRLSTDVGSLIYYTIDGSDPDLNSTMYSDPIRLDNGSMHLRAFAVSKSGIISEEFGGKYVVRDKNAEYTFIDEAVGRAVRTALGMYADSAVTFGQLDELVELFSEGRGITTLVDLKELTNLTTIVFKNEKFIEDYEVLAELTGVYAVTFEDCAVSDEQVKQIALATQLTNLSLPANGITDVSPMATLTKLKELILSKNSVSSVAGLETLIRLNSLMLDDNVMTDLDSLAKLTNVQTLSLAGNGIESIAPLAALVNVKTLDMSRNKLPDVMGISAMAALSTLNLAENQLTDISSLAGMNNLSVLDVSSNQIADYSPLTQAPIAVLTVQANGITDLSVIATIHTLRELNLSYNAVSDLSQLVTLPVLTTLYISYNNVTELSPLLGITTLTTVHYAGNNISEDDMKLMAGGTIALIAD